jgi:hypothetical protein
VQETKVWKLLSLFLINPVRDFLKFWRMLIVNPVRSL